MLIILQEGDIMFFDEWLKKRGRTSSIARHFGISPSAVSQWKNNGVPKRHMRNVEHFTKGEVTVREMIEFHVQKGFLDL